jgi:CHASE2 domain-containing sensor protein
LNGNITKKDIEGKIVMFGFLGPGNEDKFFSPLNTNPNEPDMYGLEYLANVVAQVLEN